MEEGEVSEEGGEVVSEVDGDGDLSLEGVVCLRGVYGWHERINAVCIKKIDDICRGWRANFQCSISHYVLWKNHSDHLTPRVNVYSPC